MVMRNRLKIKGADGEVTFQHAFSARIRSYQAWQKAENVVKSARAAHEKAKRQQKTNPELVTQALYEINEVSLAINEAGDLGMRQDYSLTPFSSPGGEKISRLETRFRRSQSTDKVRNAPLRQGKDCRFQRRH